MSKITQALEKAARDRLQRGGETPTVSSAPVRVPLAAPAAGEAAPAEEIHVDPHIVSAADAKSPIAEQYRVLKTNLQSLRLRHGPKTLVITSAVHGEGKSVTAANLALTLARQEHLKVLLIDGDLRKGSIHRWLRLPDRTKGLSTVLSQGGVLDGSLVRLQSPALTILPAGPTPEHPDELLESASMKRLLATLKTQFDLLLIDSPPVLAVTDPCILSAQADGVLLVTWAGKTQRRMIAQTQALLEHIKAPVIGCVLTHVDHHLAGYYYRYYQDAQQAKARDAAGPPVSRP